MTDYAAEGSHTGQAGAPYLRACVNLQFQPQGPPRPFRGLHPLSRVATIRAGSLRSCGGYPGLNGDENRWLKIEFSRRDSSAE